LTLQQIWILQDTGTCLFHQKYDDNSSDENLISGFLSAVNSFVGSFGAEIKWIEADTLRFVFRRTEELIFVACTTPCEHAPTTYKRLNRIAEQFKLMFNGYIKSNGDAIPIDIFKKIAPSVNRIFGLPDEAGRIIKTDCTNKREVNYKFASPEARLMSFIRYKRTASLTDIVKFLRISDEEANNTIQKLEEKRFVRRSETLEGEEIFGLSPSVRIAF
jgi:hypothetical protein